MTGIFTPRERAILRDLVARERLKREAENAQRDKGMMTYSEALAELRALRPEREALRIAENDELRAKRAERKLRREVEQLRATFATCADGRGSGGGCKNPVDPESDDPYCERHAFPHGKRTGYQRGCKCEPCMEAQREYERERRRRRAA